MSQRLPTLFVSHGAPTLALDRADAPGTHGGLAAALRQVAASMPRPSAVLVVSAHWGSGQTMFTGSSAPSTVRDFTGFDPALHAVEYPAPGSASLVERVHRLLAEASFEAGVDFQRGLDHGAWVPLLHLYPRADVPVVQMSLDPSAGAGEQYAIGQGLSALPGQGVLVIGSGGISHNLRAATGRDGAGAEVAWARAFADWVDARLVAGDVESLLEWQDRAPEPARNHPTAEHLLPLFHALGAAGDRWQARRFHRGAVWGSVMLDGWSFGPSGGR